VFLLKGSIAWYANLAKTGSAEIELPDKVKNTTKAYFNDHDSVSAWIECACQKKGSEKRADLYKNYEVWCVRQLEKKLTAGEFFSNLEMKKYVVNKHGDRMVKELSLLKIDNSVRCLED
jgi:hypothetical protein